MGSAINLARTRRWRSPTAAIAWAVGAFGLVSLTGVLSFATFAEMRSLMRPLPPTPPEVTRDLIVRHAEDEAGRRASFRILLFTDEFRWRLNSYEALDADGGRPRFTSEMKAVLDDAKEIICVGASSEEIPAGVSYAIGRAAEERRAARRAERIALWVREALSRPVPVRKLNVGHHALTGGRDTADQRRVVIILVLEQDEETNLDQALRAAMAHQTERAPIFDTLLTRYSLSNGERFAWVP